jgi:hypothetical protein
MQAAHEGIYEKDKKKEEATTIKVELAIGGVARSSRATGISKTRGNERDSMNSPYMRSSPSFVPKTRDGAQPSIQTMVRKKEKQAIDRVEGRCLF